MSQGLSNTSPNSENLKQLNGTAVDTNSGTKSAGTLRVVLATDQPALTNKLLVTPDLAALAATSTKQSDGSQKTQIVDGSGNVIGSTTNALDVNIKSGGATGTQYAEGATAATGTGTLSMGKNGTTVKAIQTDTSGNLIVKGTGTFTVDGSGTTQPVSGSVTANAGTNLNTSALALETGGNLASVATNTTNIPNTVGTAASAIPSKLIQVGGSDGTNARAIKTNTSGQLDIRPLTSADTVTAVSGTATNLKAQAETYQGGTAVGSGNPLQVTLANNGSNATAVKVDGTGGSFPVSGTVSITSNSAVNVAQINGVTPLMGNGTAGTGSARVTVASDNTPFAVMTDQTTHGTTDLVAADITKVAGSAISQGHGTAATAIRVELPTDGTGVVGLAAGSNTIGSVKITDGTNTQTFMSTTTTSKFGADANILSILGTAPTSAGKIDVKAASGDLATNIDKIAGSAIATGNGTASGSIRVALPTDGTGVVGLNAGTNNIGFVTPTPGTTGGWTKWSTPKNNSNTALVAPAGGVNVKSGAGTLGGYMIYNPNSSVAYVQVFDATSATLGTTRPDMVLAIPALSSANLEMVNGINFGTGITVAATTTDSGSSAVGTGLTVTLWYK